MRARGIAFVALLSTAGCQIDVLGDWKSEQDPWCEPASCGGDHAVLSLAVPMAEADIQRTDLWLSVCHAGECANEVQLEWRCESGHSWCELECSARADVLGGHVELRRGGSCGGAGAGDGVCLELDLPTSGLHPGDTEVAVVLDDAVSGRRVVDQMFSIELAEAHIQSCAGAKTCLKGERSEEISAFDPATAAPGAQQLSLEAASISIAAAERHSCGTRADGSLACWGDLPAPDGKELVPVGLFQSIAVGSFQDCALGLDGIVTCFGNEWLAGRALEPPAGVFRQIAVGPSFACGVRPSGRVECWGDDACRLQRALDLTEIDRVVASTSGTTLCVLGAAGDAQCTGDWNLVLADAIRIAVSSEQLCRLAADGSAHCARPEDSQETTHPGPFIELVAGAGHACGLAVDGKVTCFGTNTALVAATPTIGFVQLSSSREHVCGITSAGGAACWGDDADGQSTPPPDFP